MDKLTAFCFLVVTVTAQKSGLLPEPAAESPFIPNAPFQRYPNPYTGYAGVLIPILKQYSNAEPGVSYQWGFEAANGISADESGTIIPIAHEFADKQVTGQYAYTSPEGIPVHVQYYADSNGFRPRVSIHGVHSLPGRST